MMVAGTKDSNNTFTGVMMGDLGKAEGNIRESGLFGFNKGSASFGFKTDGTAFIGKNGEGRIVFNGKDSVIQSGNYKENFSGMKIDLSEGLIDSYNFTLQAGDLSILSNPASIEVGDIFKASKTDFYLRTNNYKEGESGMEIALTGLNPGVRAYSGFILDAVKDNTKFIKINTSLEDEEPFRIGENCSFSWDGNITLKNGGFTIQNEKYAVTNNGASFTVDEYGHVNGYSFTAKGPIKVSGREGISFCKDNSVLGKIEFNGYDYGLIQAETLIITNMSSNFVSTLQVHKIETHEIIPSNSGSNAGKLNIEGYATQDWVKNNYYNAADLATAIRTRLSATGTLQEDGKTVSIDIEWSY